ncbi:cell division initiation protein [Streptomyces polyrhachis]|uniref:Cell division initiation protein n=1 Tax=Streptomyces polyrhachis TaxID=1282885 RepID=A0ABW2GEP9_9ACTN
MDVQKRLDEIVSAVEGARSMPMSASCVLNRTELLGMLEEVRAALPGSLAQARELIGGHEQLAEQARQEAERIVEQARAERGELLSQTELVLRAQEQAERLLTEARQEAAEIRADADDYVDSKLANFEVVLTKTIGSVDRGRAKLLGHGEPYPQEGYAEGFEEAPGPGADPAEQRRRAEDYIEAQFQAFENVLSKTLEAVGRGRQKLEGKARPIEELTAHIAGQDEGPAIPHQLSDEGFLADLAADRHPAPQAQAQAPEPAQQPAPAAVPEQPRYYEQQPGAYPQDGYPQEGYQQPDGYQSGSYPAQDYGVQDDPYGMRDPQYAQSAAQNYQQQPEPYWQQQGHHSAPQQHQQPGAYPQGGSALDETSLFDTSMIDLDQLRQYEQGR